MKHFFVVNPASGDGKRYKSLIDDIHRLCCEMKLDYEVRLTEYSGHARWLVRTALSENKDIRFYACGGDGTVNEVACGLAEGQGGELAIIPVGTGNDFVRSFSPSGDYLSLEDQLSGESMSVDLVSAGNTTFLNMLNVGFDSAVVKTIASLRDKSRLMRGRFAYILGVIINFFKLPKTTLRCVLDNGEVVEGEFLLSAFANGKYYGGGFKAASDAELDDGLLNLIFVRPCSRFVFLSLIGAYKKGTLLECEAAKKYVISKRCRSLSVTFSQESAVCIDGELSNEHTFDIEVLPRALNLSLPSAERRVELEIN